MRVLIFGGSGGLGSILTERLAAQGDELTICSRSKPSRWPSASWPATTLWVQGDIVNTDDVVRAFGTEPWDCVIHLAALLQHSCQICPQDAFRVNVDGTRNVLATARTSNVKRLIFASSIAVYGGYRGLLRESGPLGPRISLYGLTKLVGENLCENFEANTNVPAIILRYCGIYGGPKPRSLGMAWVRSEIENAVTGISTSIQASGKEHCQFTHIFDAADATIFMIKHPCPNFRIFNVASDYDNYITLEEFYSTVKRVFPSAGEIVFSGSSQSMSPVSVSRLNALGFRARYSIEDGVKMLAMSRA